MNNDEVVAVTGEITDEELIASLLAVIDELEDSIAEVGR
jgi:hypothetical protein